MQFLADILQFSVVQYAKKRPLISGLLFKMNKHKDFNKKIDLSVSTKIKKTFIPSIDPLTSYMHYHGWESYFLILNKKKELRC